MIALEFMLFNIITINIAIIKFIIRFIEKKKKKAAIVIAGFFTYWNFIMELINIIAFKH